MSVLKCAFVLTEDAMPVTPTDDQILASLTTDFLDRLAKVTPESVKEANFTLAEELIKSIPTDIAITSMSANDIKVWCLGVISCVKSSRDSKKN